MKKEQYVNYFIGKFNITADDAEALYKRVKKQWNYMPEFENYINSNKQLRYYSRTACLSMDYDDAVELFASAAEAERSLLNGMSVFDNSMSLAEHMYELPSGAIAVIYDR